MIASLVALWALGTGGLTLLFTMGILGQKIALKHAVIASFTMALLLEFTAGALYLGYWTGVELLRKALVG